MMGLSEDEIRDELLAIAAPTKQVVVRVPRRRRPGFWGRFRAMLPEKRVRVTVRPVTLGEWSMLDHVLPDDGVLTKWEWRRIRCWLAMRDAWPVEFDEFCDVFGDVESLERLRPLVEAWDEVNASFRARVESPVDREPAASEPRKVGNPATGRA